MNNIKIFVSHRIDIDSEVIENPLFIPVRCGAALDDNMEATIQGDNTGDNISERRMSFCEFTVQYWAWKNIEADYYGLCHYRRYLSFSDRHFKTDEYNMIHFAKLTPFSVEKLGLKNREKIESVITNYDIVTSEYADVRNIPTPKGAKATVYEHWCAHEDVFFENSSIDLMLNLLEEKYPAIYKSAIEYFAQPFHRGFNCYIMKKDLFFQMCELQFDIMFEIEKRINTEGYTQTMLRTPAFIGEMLYGIFIYHISKDEKIKVKKLQLSFFNNTKIIKSLISLWCFYIWNGIDKYLRIIINPIFPKGSRRRDYLKRIFFSVTPAKRHGIADPK